MDIAITQVAIEAEVSCETCGNTHFVPVDDGDTYFSESQMIDAVAERLSGQGWEDELCPDCVFDRDHQEEDN